MKTFKLSNDRHFAEKLEDLVSLYLHALDNAIILAVDEKCQIQALDRTQPGLPWKKGRCGTMTHVYKRHGTTTLFAAMHTPDGSVIDVCMPTHNRGDWIRFRKLIDRRTPSDKQLHLIMDNYSAHQAPEVHQWLARHQRFHVHWVPTSSSCLNMVELFFRDLTVERIRRARASPSCNWPSAIHRPTLPPAQAVSLDGQGQGHSGKGQAGLDEIAGGRICAKRAGTSPPWTASPAAWPPRAHKLLNATLDHPPPERVQSPPHLKQTKDYFFFHCLKGCQHRRRPTRSHSSEHTSFV